MSELTAAIQDATQAMRGLIVAMRENLPPFPKQNAVAYLAFARAERKAAERAASQRQAISAAMRRRHARSTQT